jgi:ParB/RepB/Spo0J family partition protein
MPKLDESIKNRSEKKFTKKEYRPWNLTGQLNDNHVTSETLAISKVSSDNQTILREKTSIDEVFNIPTSKITRWEYKDRPESELGNIVDLAQNIKEIGQKAPCIVRPKQGDSGIYELIAGERRFHAAKMLGIPLKVFIQDLSDYEAALTQASENIQRTDLSDYAMGMSYGSLVDEGILKQKDLIEKLGLSKQAVSKLLAFKKIPSEITESIGDMHKVSKDTAEVIYQLSNKGSEYIDAIKSQANRISTGKMGWKSLLVAVNKLVQKTEVSHDTNKKILSDDGRHLFTWRSDNNSTPSIHFPKDILGILNQNEDIFLDFTNDIKNAIAENLSKLLIEKSKVPQTGRIIEKKQKSKL